MGTKIAGAAACAAAPLLLFVHLDRAAPYATLAAGGFVCLVAYVAGFELSFVTYAVASWIVAAILLAGVRLLDSPASGTFADAAYMAACAAVAIGILRSLIAGRRPLRKRARTPRRVVERSTTP